MFHGKNIPSSTNMFTFWYVPSEVMVMTRKRGRDLFISNCPCQWSKDVDAFTGDRIIQILGSGENINRQSRGIVSALGMTAQFRAFRTSDGETSQSSTLLE